MRDLLRTLWWMIRPNKAVRRYEDAVQRMHDIEAELMIDLMESIGAARGLLDDRREFNRQQAAQGKTMDRMTGEWR